MSYSRAKLISFVAVVLAFAGPATAQIVPVAGQDGVLLLHSGQTFEGKISLVEGIYYVRLAKGEIRVKASDVEFVCRDLEEGYQRKRAALSQNTVQNHLMLADWCLQHGLFVQASQELGEAKAREPNNPKVHLLEQRMKLANYRPSAIKPVAKKPADIPTREDLDRMIRGMPPKAVETFANSIQPLLLNNCTNAGCHGAQSDAKYHLLRLPASRVPSRRLTQRNLNATLEFIDHNNPDESPLLTVPTQPHGKAMVAVFAGQNDQVAQYKALRAWVYQVTRNEAPAPTPMGAPATGEPGLLPSPFPALQPPRPETVPPQPAAQPPAMKKPPRPSPADASRLKAAKAAAQTREPSPPKRGASPPQAAPADPFDPSAFNRRYFPDEQ